MKNEKDASQGLIEKIAELYGFQKEKIREPVRSENNCVHFTVNGIQYSAKMANKAIQVEGYVTNKDCYYNRYIRHEKIVLLKKNKEDEWEDTGIRFNTPWEAEEWIRMSKVEYMYKPEGGFRKD